MLASFKHQEDFVDATWHKAYYAVLWEMGTGKSRVAIQTIERQYKAGMISAAFIVMPKSLLLNWQQIELPKHSSEKYKTYLWDGEGAGTEGILYFLVNSDAILTKRFPSIFKSFLKNHSRFNLTVDEVSLFKSHKAARTKRVISIARLASTRRIMSGTPVTQSPMDLYSETEILRENLLGFKNWYSMRAHYAKMATIPMGSRSFQKVVGYRNLDDLKENLLEFSSIIKKKDVLDLPPVMFRKFPIEFTPEQRLHYDELKHKALTYIQGSEITVINAIGLINRLLQISAGQIKLPDGSYVSIPTNRLDALKELVNECEGKTIIWSAFVNVSANIKDYLGDSCVHIKSDISTSVRQELLDDFRKNNSKKSLVMNPASGGMGITLIESSNVIYHDRLWSLEHRLQSLARTDRIGQTQEGLVTDLYTPDTLEEKVIDALVAKKELSDNLISSNYIKELLS